uniref:Uncharacterized protein n=1 Tax=Sus scrofa TaxID=9823 RepID=A0A4X1SHA3_PIG
MKKKIKKKHLIYNVWILCEAYIQVYQEIWVGMELRGFIIYKIKSADKRSKVLKTSSPGPAHSHHQPALFEVYIRGNISLAINVSKPC